MAVPSSWPRSTAVSIYKLPSNNVRTSRRRRPTPSEVYIDNNLVHIRALIPAGQCSIYTYIHTCFLPYSTEHRPNRARGCTPPPLVGPSLAQTSQTRSPLLIAQGRSECGEVLLKGESRWRGSVQFQHSSEC